MFGAELSKDKIVKCININLLKYKLNKTHEGISEGQHINAEIENALSTPRNQLTLVAFSEGGAEGLPEPIERWRENPVWGKQIFVAGSRGIYQGSSEAVFGREEGGRDWWTFGGVAKLLSQGFPSDVVEQIQ